MKNIYDFDKTIFDGDSTARFCLYVLGRNPRIWPRFIPVGFHFLAMALKLEEKTQAKQALYRALLCPLRNVDEWVDSFWQKNFCRIKGWYVRQKRDDDLIISASPEFLLQPVCQKLGVQLMASRVDKKTGMYQGLNCHGQEKVRRYREKYPPEEFEFYSDSLSDAPMARIAQKAWLVKGDCLSPWPRKG